MTSGLSPEGARTLYWACLRSAGLGQPHQVIRLFVETASAARKPKPHHTESWLSRALQHAIRHDRALNLPSGNRALSDRS